MRVLTIKNIDGSWKKSIGDITGSMESIQEAVGGYYETHKLFGSLYVACNQDSYLMGHKPNNILQFPSLGSTLYGDIMIFSSKGGATMKDLTDQEIEALYIFMEKVKGPLKDVMKTDY